MSEDPDRECKAKPKTGLVRLASNCVPPGDARPGYPARAKLSTFKAPRDLLGAAQAKVSDNRKVYAKLKCEKRGSGQKFFSFSPGGATSPLF